jgi:hypothetical protein
MYKSYVVQGEHHKITYWVPIRSQLEWNLDITASCGPRDNRFVVGRSIAGIFQNPPTSRSHERATSDNVWV